ncbi:hypothetical protein HMPREF1512_2142 [Streptococcus sp. OBRC6]|nr:hypothetical protein HMPREF1512_2142 [Streptococcus sp. OBRC6]
MLAFIQPTTVDKEPKLLAITTRKNKSNLIGLVSFYFYKEFT